MLPPSRSSSSRPSRPPVTCTSLRWPPKNTSPRAPFAIAWYAMKRSSSADGNRGTRFWLLGRRDHAAPRDLQRHPERLGPRRLLDPAREVADDADVLVRLVGVRTRRIADRVDVDTRDVKGRAIGNQPLHRAARRLDDHQRMVGVERVHDSMAAREVGRRDRQRRVERIARLVVALPGAERRVGAQALDDLREQLLLWRRCTRRQVGQRAEPDPAVETVRRGSIELGALGSELLRRSGRPTSRRSRCEPS